MMDLQRNAEDARDQAPLLRAKDPLKDKIEWYTGSELPQHSLPANRRKTDQASCHTHIFFTWNSLFSHLTVSGVKAQGCLS